MRVDLDVTSAPQMLCICLPIFLVHKESNSPLTQFHTVSLSDTVLLNFIPTIAQSIFHPSSLSVSLFYHLTPTRSCSVKFF